MPLHALEDLDTALAATRSFLTPVDRTTWVKLALVVLFVGGPGANLGSFGGSGGTGNGAPPADTPMGPEIGGGEWLVILAVLGVVLTLGLALLLVSSVMEFVFVDSLREREVSIREYWSTHWGKGLRLFGFRLLLGLFALAGFLLFLAPFLLPLLEGDEFGAGASVALLVLLVPFFLVLALLVALVDSFTTEFVVPIMLLEDRGVLAGWRRLWATITRDWQQYLAYVVAAFFLGILGGIAVGVATAIVAVVLFVPFGVLFAIGFGVFALLSEPIGVAVLVVVGILFALAVLAAFALVQVPVQTYLRYYALLVLGDVESDFDVIPDQRAEIREAESGA